MSYGGGFDEEVERLKQRKIQELMRRAAQGATEVGRPRQRVLELTDSNFEEALRSNRLLVVDFWAPWCGPCRIVSPIIEELAEQYAGRLAFGKLNVDENPLTAQAYGIQSIPTIMFFKDGEPVDLVVGAAPKAYYEAKIRRVLEAAP